MGSGKIIYGCCKFCCSHSATGKPSSLSSTRLSCACPKFCTSLSCVLLVKRQQLTLICALANCSCSFCMLSFHADCTVLKPIRFTDIEQVDCFCKHCCFNKASTALTQPLVNSPLRPPASKAITGQFVDAALQIPFKSSPIRLKEQLVSTASNVGFACELSSSNAAVTLLQTP